MKFSKKILVASGCILVLALPVAFGSEADDTQQTATAKKAPPKDVKVRASSERAAPVARYKSQMRTRWDDPCRQGDMVTVLDTSAVPQGAQKYRVEGLHLPGQTQQADIWCDAYGEDKSFKDCYSCNSSVPAEVPYSQACDYLGFCTEGYNGNSSYCSFP